MLNFLRKIRLSLIESLPSRQAGGSAKKYILYAIGEIALVVIGILIALQINIWNQQRQLNNTENIYLLRIYDDVNTMLQSSSIFDNGQEYLNQTLLALRGIEKCSVTEEEKKALERTLEGHQSLGLFPTKRTAYDEMLATGMIAQLRNDSLKTMISDLYASIEASQNRLEYFRDELGRASQVIMKSVQFSIGEGQFKVLYYDVPSLCKNTQFRNAMVEVYDARSDTYGLGVDIRNQLIETKKILESILD